MSTVVVSTSAALGRPFLFDDESGAEVVCQPERSGKYVKRISRGVEGSLPDLKTSLDPRLAGITAASRLEIHPAPEMAPSGIPALDALTGGLPRGCLTEICGTASSGRTSVMLAALAAATRRGEYCAIIDASDSLDPHSLAAAGVDLDRLLWVRCSENLPQRYRDTEKKPPSKKDLRTGNQSEHRLEQVLRVTDLLLESGGFGLIILDLTDVPYQAARRIPLTTWFRFRRSVEHKPTILLAIEQQAIAGSCSSLQLQLSAAKRRQNAAHVASRGDTSVVEGQAPEGRKKNCGPVKTIPRLFPSHAHLLTELEIRVELIRSRLDRKPARSVAFETKTAWAG